MAGRPKILHPEEVMEFLLAQEDAAKSALATARDANKKTYKEMCDAENKLSLTTSAVIAYQRVFQQE